MAEQGMRSATGLAAPLAGHGIRRDPSRLWRLVNGTPRRIDIRLLLALCDIFGCQLTGLAVPATRDDPQPGTYVRPQRPPRQRPGRR
jgi:hypothetical protein